MINITRADARWLLQLLVIAEYIQKEYPELFTKDEDETMKVAGELIRSIT